MIRRIEIEFALPVELEDAECRDLCIMIEKIARRHQPEGWYHWQAGAGSKPHFSRADCIFLGKSPEPDAPDQGEPTFDDEVFHIETFAREAYPEELERDRQRARNKGEI